MRAADRLNSRYMSLDDIVSLTIDSATSTPTKPGFGTCLVAAYHTKYNDRVRSYTGLKGMVSDGFAATDAAYKAVARAFSQNPRPKRVKLGRRALPFTQTLDIKCLGHVENDVINITVAGREVSYTIVSGDTTNTLVATHLATAISAALAVSPAVATVGVSTSTDTVILTQTAGVLIDLADWTRNVSIKDVTANPGLETDLAVIAAADSDWYGLALDSNSKAEVAKAAEFAEANGKFFAFTTADTECVDSGVTTDVISAQKTLGYARTFPMYCGKQLLSFGGAGLWGKMLPKEPGTATFKFKKIAGVPVDDDVSLTDTEKAVIISKNGNTYKPTAGLSILENGVTASGEFADLTWGSDWLKAEMQTNVYARLANADKVSFTKIGVASIVSIMEGVLRQAVARDILAADPAPTVTAPEVADVSLTDKSARNLPDLSFQGEWAGAIHSVEMTGSISA